ncbi:MAG: TetR/AcrR family transcriptional regulator [Candidatus Coatesbacteria bacterium]|nr:MAG: TetR/AcrR family transcriptional regulator [Candidatus Coatesbacteria bacterium]
MDADSKKMSRRERERQLRRQEILEAARAVFSARGYEGATLDEVAREAEFAKGTLYSYFDSKADLFAALVEREFEHVTERVKEVLAGESEPVRGVRAVIRVLLEFFESRSDFFRAAMALRDTGQREEVERIRATVKKKVDELGDIIGARLADGIRDGHFKEYDARFLGFLLLGIVHNYSVCAIKHGGDESLVSGADMLCDIYLDGVRILRPDVPEEE